MCGFLILMEDLRYEKNISKEALRANFNDTVKEFGKYYNDPEQHHKIFTELGFTLVDDGCDGFCPECEQKLECGVSEELKDEWEELYRNN
jgi:hypothetical protein